MTSAPDSLTIFPARDDTSLAQARSIFLEYATWIESTHGYSLSKQSFTSELASLPGRYSPPEGEILLACHGGTAAGAIAFYRLEDGIAELKRFYVLPAMAGLGIGTALFDAALHVAKARGYTSIRLDTLKSMTHARALYAHYAFREIPPYNDNYKDTPDLLYYALDLSTI